MNAIDRFWAKVDRSAGLFECWLWTGARIRGYGSFHVTSGTGLAHRIAYELLIGPIPDGLTLDHLCRTPACVNPSHLEPVTLGENALRGIGSPAQNARKSACIAGHPFDEANTYRQGGRRQCRACNREAVRRLKARRATVPA